MCLSVKLASLLPANLIKAVLGVLVALESCLVSQGKGRSLAGLFGLWMAFEGLADFQELVTSGHSCKYLLLLWEQGRCQAKLLSCRSPPGESFPMTYGRVSQDAIPFPRRVVRDFD